LDGVGRSAYGNISVSSFTRSGCLNGCPLVLCHPWVGPPATYARYTVCGC